MLSNTSSAGLPAGSFKYDRFVRSSLASSMVGFMSGGRLGLESSCSAATVVSNVRLYRSRVNSDASIVTGLPVVGVLTSPLPSSNTSVTLSP